MSRPTGVYYIVEAQKLVNCRRSVSRHVGRRYSGCAGGVYGYVRSRRRCYGEHCASMGRRSARSVDPRLQPKQAVELVEKTLRPVISDLLWQKPNYCGYQASPHEGADLQTQNQRLYAAHPGPSQVAQLPSRRELHALLRRPGFSLSSRQVINSIQYILVAFVQRLRKEYQACVAEDTAVVVAEVLRSVPISISCADKKNQTR